jgi:hypothetical protein
MTPILRNPLDWLKRKTQDSISSSLSRHSPKPPAKPATPKKKRRKSGSVFIQLIGLQRQLQALELDLRQKNDFTVLLQEILDQISVLRAEAERADEQDLAGVIGQVSAYFDTVSDGRLELNAEGLTVIRDFVLIFKDAIGDAAPGVSHLDKKQLRAWTMRYQALMAGMQPVYEEVVEDREDDEFENRMILAENTRTHEEEASAEGIAVTEKMSAADQPFSSELEIDERRTEEETEPLSEPSSAEQEAALDIDYQRESFVAFHDAQETGDTPDEIEATELEEDEEPIVVPPVDTPVEEEIPFYDPSADRANRDITISDAEIKSVREYIERGESKPDVLSPPSRTDVYQPERIGMEPETDGADEQRPDEPSRSSIQREEIERLKQKIFELHQKQDMLSSTVNGMIGDIKAAMNESSSRTKEQPDEQPEDASVEDLSIDDLEDIIFIGRNKG